MGRQTEGDAMIPYTSPWITRIERNYVNAALDDGFGINSNHYQQRFEAAFAEYIGVDYALALPSCTSAIHLALVALGVGPGDEVIVPECTWIATAAPINYVGAIPIFCDIDAATWCMDVDSMERCITDKTKAIIPVDLYGCMPDYAAILDRDIPIIEDAAEAVGSIYNGDLAGWWGDAACFSFHGSKTITTGEGGMLVTRRKDVYERSLKLRNHGRMAPSFIPDEIGYKYKMSCLQAGLGLAQLSRIRQILEAKRNVFGWYKEALADTGLQMNAEPPGILNSYWMVTVLLATAEEREKAAWFLEQKGVATRPMFAPLSSLAVFDNVQGWQDDTPHHVAYDVCFRGLNLPSGPTLTREQVRYVCRCLKVALR